MKAHWIFKLIFVIAVTLGYAWLTQAAVSPGNGWVDAMLTGDSVFALFVMVMAVFVDWHKTHDMSIRFLWTLFTLVVLLLVLVVYLALIQSLGAVDNFAYMAIFGSWLVSSGAVVAVYLMGSTEDHDFPQLMGVIVIGALNFVACCVAVALLPPFVARLLVPVIWFCLSFLGFYRVSVSLDDMDPKTPPVINNDD